MTEKQMNNLYFNWIFEHCCKEEKYTELLSHLHNRVFTYNIPLDGNRYEDGVSLRYRFAYDEGYSDHLAARYLDNRDCTILEMMAALAIRVEDDIMGGDPDYDERSHIWFMDMIHSLGLAKFTNDRFDIDKVDKILDKFLNRDYKPNGKGGLFTLKNCKNDLRDIEIWYQCMWYLNGITD